MAREKLTPQQRRRWILVGIALAAFVLLVLVPGIVASRPQYFGRFPSLAEKYDPWAKSTHVSAGCAGCHVKPGIVSQGAYRVGMLGTFYASLVARSAVPAKFGEPTNAACLSCHDDLRSVSPKGDLKIPHKAHVNILKMRCVQCHSYLVHEVSPEGKHTPPMAACLKCHDGDRAKNTCTACHTKKAPPETHKASDWLVEHPVQAKVAGARCEKCHKWTERWCADCHSHRPKSHGADWRKKHGDAVKTHRNCEACHKPAFCEKCHGEHPKENLDPAMKLVQ